MKAAYFCLAGILLTLLFSTGSFAAEHTGLTASQAQDKKLSFAMDKALEDIAGNMEFIIAIRAEFGETAYLSWATRIADKLPSQPVAVIRLMALTEYPVADMCPREFLEDTATYEQMERWMERAGAALESFSMRDPKEESVRKACLQEIDKALTEKERWKF